MMKASMPTITWASIYQLVSQINVAATVGDKSHDGLGISVGENTTVTIQVK